MCDTCPWHGPRGACHRHQVTSCRAAAKVGGVYSRRVEGSRRAGGTQQAGDSCKGPAF